MSSSSNRQTPTALEWRGGPDGHVEMIDQTLLPRTERILDIDDLDQMIDAIRRLAVRGAPAIGIAAAYGLVIGTRRGCAEGDGMHEAFDRSASALRASRPTAVNLGWALDRMQRRFDRDREEIANDIELLAGLLSEAQTIHAEDRALCRAIGEAGEALIPEGGRMLTHCNAGALATGGIGTALALCHVARERGRQFEVFADETRPLLQGARLTAWELKRQQIPVTVICDGAAASVMRDPGIDLVVTGADRVTARGDVANKIGTYGLALAARAQGIPFYVAAPSSTFDLDLVHGAEIPIEVRAPEEILEPFGQRIAPPGVKAFAPAFDVTPAELITGLITERGVLPNPDEASLRRHLA